MASRLVKLGVFIAWAFILLFPMVAGQFSVQTGKFYWDWARLGKVMLVIVAGGVLVVVYQSMRKAKKPGEKKRAKTPLPKSRRATAGSSWAWRHSFSPGWRTTTAATWP